MPAGHRIPALTVALALGTTLALGSAAARANEFGAQAQQFVAELADRAGDLLTNENEELGTRQTRFRSMFRESFDVPSVARFVLGRHWRRAEPDERDEYLQLFEDLVVSTWAHRFAEYDRNSFTIRSTRVEADEYAIVGSEVIIGASEPFRVEWRIERPSSTYKIVDIIIEGVSMAITQRSEFASVIRRHGGKLEGLVELERL